MGHRDFAVALTLVLLASASLAASAAAQPGAQPAVRRTPEQIRASWEAHRGDFDYLLGDWEFIVENPDYGRNHGRWSAVRLAEGQILDEYRIIGESGETYYLTTTLRSYNAVTERWELVGMEQGTGLQDVGTGERRGEEVHIEQRFGVMSEHPSVWRIRYHSIGPDSFSWVADRSTDGGRTWVEDYQRIEARRIGPARSLEPLTRAHPVAGGGAP